LQFYGETCQAFRKYQVLKMLNRIHLTLFFVTFASFVKLLHGLINQKRICNSRSSKETMFPLSVLQEDILYRWSGKFRRKAKTLYNLALVSVVNLFFLIKKK